MMNQPTKQQRSSTRIKSAWQNRRVRADNSNDSCHRVVSFTEENRAESIKQRQPQQEAEQPSQETVRNIALDRSASCSDSSFRNPSSKRNSSFNKHKKNDQRNGESNTKNKVMSSWAGRRFGKRFSFFGPSTGGEYGKRRNGYGTLDDSNNINDDDVDAPTAVEADDPVMTIFESRNTQRVRFTLGNDGGNSSVINNGVCVGENNSNNSNKKSKNKEIRGDSEGQNHLQKRFSSSTTKGCENGYVSGNGTGNIKQFMSRALFGSSANNKSGNTAKKLSEEEMKQEVKELGGSSLIWESAATPTGPEVIHTKNNRNRVGNYNDHQLMATPELLLSFTENPKARAVVSKLLVKAHKAEHMHFRYEYAVKCYLKALNILQKQANYPDDHPTVIKTVQLMNNAHHVLSSYNNSANIVKMGIKNEDAGELVKALKMYTIAYRIRRDNLSRNHPSLVVLLNMLGSIQIKRGELKEAMQIYELALNDDPIVSRIGAASSDSEDRLQQETTVEPEKHALHQNLLAQSVTFREIGTIHEMWGNVDEALRFYHRSLECVAKWRENLKLNFSKDQTCFNNATEDAIENRNNNLIERGKTSFETRNDKDEIKHCCLDNVQTISSGDRMNSGSSIEHGEMELVFGSGAFQKGTNKPLNLYEKFFPNQIDTDTKEGSQNSDPNSHADMDLSLTLHQIAQLYRTQGKFDRALDAYEVALCGMKTALGRHHPNVAAVLGNMGICQKESGHLNEAYATYQEVLGIESCRLGLSHPDVAITLHNIATIDAARGNYEHSLQLYRKVIGLQKNLFGEENVSVAVTAACMGDVYEKIGDLKHSLDSYDEAVRIKSAVLGRHSLEVGRLLHKLGKLSFLTSDYPEAESYIARTILIYRLNKLTEDHEWFVDANRDSADIDGAIAVGNRVDQCEI